MSVLCKHVDSSLWRSLAAAGLLAAAGFAAYSNTFYSPFVFDGLHLADRLQKLSWTPNGWFDTQPRTFGYFTFDLQYTIHDRWLPGYHAVNIAIHVIAACALYGAVLLTCERPTMPAGIRHDAAGIAVASALLFELHPLQTQAVTYLFQRFESLMGMFFLLAMLCFALATRAEPVSRWQRVGWLVATWLAVILSITSKEVGVVAPLVLLWYDRVFVADSWRSLVAARWWFYLPFCAVMLAGAAYLYLNRDHYVAGGIFAADTISPLAYARTQPEVICHYLRLVVWPQGQCLDYLWPVSRSLSRIIPAALVILAAVIVTGWATLRRPWLGFLLGAFVLILAPTSSIAPIIDLAVEHRMYLPLAPLAVLGAVAGRSAVNSIMARALIVTNGSAALSLPRSKTIVVAFVAAALGVATYLRNDVYRDGVTLWTDVVQKAPRNHRGYTHLAWHIDQETGDTAEAIRIYRSVLRLSPDIANAHRYLAILLCDTDRRQALYHARTAVRLERNADNLNNLGIFLAESNPAGAEACFREAMALDSRLSAPAINLNRLLALQPKLGPARPGSPAP